MDRSETEVDLDLKYLQEKLALLEEPPLPPSLTAEALFRRLDAGELSLPEQAPGEEPPEEQASPEVPAEAPDGKVLPWSRPLRRWLPLAACLVVVLLLYRGYQAGLSNGFGGASAAAPQMAAEVVMEDSDSDGGSSADAAGVPAPLAAPPPPEPGPAAGDGPGEEAQKRSLPGSEAATSGESAPTEDVPTENTLPENIPAGNAPAETASPEGSGPDSPPAGEDGEAGLAGSPPVEAPGPGGGDGDGNPDTGGSDSGSAPGNIHWFQGVDVQMKALSLKYAPEGLSPGIRGFLWNHPEEGQMIFDVCYRDKEGEVVVVLCFRCRICPEPGKQFPLLELLSYQETD